MKRTLITALTAVLLAAPTLSAQQGTGDAPPMAGMGRMVRGTVTAVAPDHMTLKTETGDVYQVAINPNTRLTKDRQPLKVADVHVGDGIGAMGEVDQPTKTVHALYIGIMDAEQIKKAREAMGKTWIAGKVTAIDDLKITVLRSDGVSQVIAVDEDTSFKKGGRGMQMMMNPSAGPATAPTPTPAGAAGGESITLADIKVGDNIAGQGTLKNGTFVPTTLGVGEPGQGGGAGRRRRNPTDPSTQPPPQPRPSQSKGSLLRSSSRSTSALRPVALRLFIL